MKLSAIDTETASDVLEDAAHTVVEAYRNRGVKQEGVVSPELLTDALRQFFAIMQSIDERGGSAPSGGSIYDTLAAAEGGSSSSGTQGGPAASDTVRPEDITELGEHSFNALSDLAQWAEQLQLPRARQQADALSVPVAIWVARHGGEIRELESVVNALAAIANSTNEPELLRELSQVMGELAGAASAEIRQDLDRGNPSRPWRVLNLNRGIVAARSCDTEAMTAAFDDMIRYLPDDAPSFFDEGVKQAEAMGLPGPVRDLIAEYRKRGSGKGLH